MGGLTAMRVLHLVNWLNHAGSGITNVAVDLAWAQVDAGHDVHVATCGGSFVSVLREHGVTAHHLDMTAGRLDRRMAEVRHLNRIVRSTGPDVIHTHMIASTALARLSTRSPVVATVHNEFQRGVALMGMAHHVVGVSSAVTRAMHMRGVPWRKLSTVHNGVVGSPRRLAADDQTESTAPGPKIMALGAVSHRKGADVLVDAMGLLADRLPDAHLYFVGNLDWPDVGDLVAARGLTDRVHFCGYRTHPEVLLRQADIFVLPSRRDPYPLALLEAMELGLPIVASRVDGVPEALGDGAFGLLTPPEDAESLADAIERLVSDRELARVYGEAARARAADFTIQAMQRGYLEVYERVHA